MRLLFSLGLLTGFVLVSQGSPPEKPKAALPMFKADAVDPLAFKQVSTASPELGYDVPRPVTSLKGGLPAVQKAADHPIIAMAESKGWFFYATSAVRDGQTGKPVFFLSGYAVKRGTRRVVGFGVW
jgi:hypothetical protein